MKLGAPRVLPAGERIRGRKARRFSGSARTASFPTLAWVHQELGELNYPLLADFTKQVSREYGVLLERLGAALRGTFLIDPGGLVRAYTVQDLTVGRSVDEILRLLCALQTGALTPVGWRPGEPFIPPRTEGKGKSTLLF